MATQPFLSIPMVSVKKGRKKEDREPTTAYCDILEALMPALDRELPRRGNSTSMCVREKKTSVENSERKGDQMGGEGRGQQSPQA